MKTDLLNQLEQQLGQLTRMQQKVADYIIRNPMEAAFSTVDQLCHAVGVSAATVVRLAMVLGYSGYTEFQKDLKEYLQTYASPSRKLAIHEYGIDQNKLSDTMLSKIADLTVDNLSQTAEALSEEQILGVVNQIIKAGRIFVAGARSLYAPAYYLNFNLNRMFANSTLLTQVPGELPTQLMQIRKDDLVFAISLSRYNRQILNIVEAAKERGAFVICISDAYNNPFAPFTDSQLIVNARSVDFHNSVTAVFFLIDVLIGYCTSKATKKVKGNLEQAEHFVKQLNLMVKN